MRVFFYVCWQNVNESRLYADKKYYLTCKLGETNTDCRESSPTGDTMNGAMYGSIKNVKNVLFALSYVMSPKGL